jgi:alkyl hydroperoxide reductase subunit F
MFELNLDQNKHVLDSEILYDLIIIGTGPAGLSAGIYAKRKGLKVGMIGDKAGGQVNDTSSVENYIGFDYVTGEGLAKKFSDHAESLAIDQLKHKVKSIEKKDDFIIHADNFMTYQTKTVLIATGSTSRKLGIKGEEEFSGRGVSYCAICDGPLFEDRTITIAGGGNSAVEAAIDLSRIAKEVRLVHRSTFRADQILLDKLDTLDNVEVHLGTRIKEIKGDQIVTSIELEGDTQGNFKTDGVMIEIGYVPNSQFTDVIKNERGEIIIDEHNKTSIEGIYAAGDVTEVHFKQIVVAAGEGAKAALSINDYLNTL